MQHPDEGTIHSWLDGALSAEDAARIESHVAACETCAAAVAEARGFIAASSRILTALDHVPRGVIPAAAAPRGRGMRTFLRAAAAILVVAVGSLVVLRNEGSEMKGTSAVDNVAPEAATNIAAVDSAPPPVVADAQTQAAAPTAPAAATAAPRQTTQNTSERAGTVAGDLAQKSVAGAVGGTDRRTLAAGGAPAPTAPAVVSRTETDLAAPAEAVVSLRRVRADSAIGERRIVYEVAPGQTVTLIEHETLRLESVVATGAAAPLAQTTGKAASRVGERSRANTMAAAAAPAPPPPPAVQPLADSLSKLATIEWIEGATGRKLTLTGALPRARLEEIKLAIEKERAATRTRAP